VKRYKLDCDPVQNGWVQSAVDEAGFRRQENLADDYETFGGGLEVLSKEELSNRTGARGYFGGLYCPTAGSIQPLSYTRELARTAIELGAQVFTESPIKTINQTSDGWSLKTDKEIEVSCGQVLICTNGYTDKLVPGLAQKLIPIRSVLMASEPLSEELRAEILPNQVTFVDKRRLILYFRYDRDGRLCVGDHGPMRDVFYPNDYKAVTRRAIKVFPKLADLKWDYKWGGRIAMTRSHLPFITQPKPGLTAGMGCNGRGVGMSTLMGINLAKSAIANMKGEERPLLDFPVTRPKSYPFHSFHPLGVKVGIAWAAFRDELQERRAQA